MINISNYDINNPLVSIITPTYNSEKFIHECIESVLNQTYSSWELIIVNDASTDNTISIIEKYIEKDNRIRVYTQETNSGVAIARNRAINMARGRFIAFLDSDDIWKPQKLEKQITYMLDNNYAFTFTAYEVFNSNDSRKRKIFNVPSKINYNQYLTNTIIGNLTVIMDRKIIGDISVEVGQLEDALTWMKYLKKGYIAYGLNENLAEYRIVPNSVSSNKLENAKKYYRCLRKYQNLSLVKSVYYELCYILNALKKRFL